MKRTKRNLREVLDMERQLAFEWHPSATVSTAEASHLLGITDDMVLRLIHSGSLEARRKSQRPGSTFRIYLDSLERLRDCWQAALNRPPAESAARRETLPPVHLNTDPPL